MSIFEIEERKSSSEYLTVPKTTTNKQNQPIMAHHKNDNPNKNQMSIELTDEIAEGIYSNLAIIAHSPSEFVVDFVRIVPNRPKAKVKARIILTPQHAKRLMRALADNVQKFESLHGPIQEPDSGGIPPMNFNVPPAQA